MWGILGGTMPRSGGAYIFNSRIINPPLAIAASVATAIAGIYWVVFSATWLTKPSLTMLAQFMGWQSLAVWAQGSKWATLEIGIGGLVLVVSSWSPSASRCTGGCSGRSLLSGSAAR